MSAEIKRYYQIHCEKGDPFIDYVEAYGKMEPGTRIQIDDESFGVIVEEISEEEYIHLVMKVEDD